MCLNENELFFVQIELAFRLMLTGRPELIQQAIPLLPPCTRLDTLNQQGHTALMLATLYNDDATLMVSRCCLINSMLHTRLCRLSSMLGQQQILKHQHHVLLSLLL